MLGIRGVVGLAFSMLVLSGCSTVTVTYHSNPEGATLYANHDHQRFGLTPMSLTYKPSRAFLSGKGCDTVQGAMVRWASGSEASVETLSLCPRNGRHQQYVFVRPLDAPNRAQDVATALEVSRQAMAREEAESARRRAAIQSAADALARRSYLSGPAGGVIESRIDGTFEGWSGETIFLLQNGQIWQQTQYAYHYHYAYSPAVVIYRTSSGYQLKVDNVTPTITVVRLR